MNQSVIHQVEVFIKEIIAWNAFYGFSFFAFPYIGVINHYHDTVTAKTLQFRHDKALAPRIKRRHCLVNQQNARAFLVEKDL
jgi:hypothetical protein